jgi:protocatechuate 3,4-dioxygenase beta subunit
MTKSNEPASPSRRHMLLTSSSSISGLLTAAAFGGFSTKAFTAGLLTPTMTEGPFCLDNVANKLLRTDVRTGSISGVTAVGLPLLLTITVSKLDGNGAIAPLRGVYVDIWHCDAYGHYSGEINDGTADLRKEDYLRGYQITDARGVVKFTTIYPGWYPGRTTHIHTRLRTYSGNSVVYDQATQFYFDEILTRKIYSSTAPYISHGLKDTDNASDMIYNGSSDQSDIDHIESNAGSHLMLHLSNNAGSVNASINLVITPSSGIAGLNCPMTGSDTPLKFPGYKPR